MYASQMKQNRKKKKPNLSSCFEFFYFHFYFFFFLPLANVYLRCVSVTWIHSLETDCIVHTLVLLFFEFSFFFTSSKPLYSSDLRYNVMRSRIYGVWYIDGIEWKKCVTVRIQAWFCAFVDRLIFSLTPIYKWYAETMQELDALNSEFEMPTRQRVLFSL